MALISSYMIATATGGNDLVLSPLVGQSLLVKGVYISDTESGYATLEISKSTVGYFRMDYAQGNHLAFPHNVANAGGSRSGGNINLLDYMLQNTPFEGYPVGQGETFRVTGAWSANSRIAVVYETYGASDQLPTNQNGSQSDQYQVVLYGAVNGGINAAGYFSYNVAENPAQFPEFPYQAAVPSNTQIGLYGIVGREFLAVSGTANEYSFSDYLKLTRDRTVLFDEDKNGLLFRGDGATGTVNTVVQGQGSSVIGDLSNQDSRPPFELNPYMNFAQGDELQVQVHVSEVTAPGTITQAESVIGLIASVRITG